MSNVIHLDLSALTFTVANSGQLFYVIQLLATDNPGDVDVLNNLAKAIENGAVTGFVTLTYQNVSFNSPFVTYEAYVKTAGPPQTTIKLGFMTAVQSTITENDIDEIYVSAANTPFAFEQGGSFTLPCNRISRPVDRQGRTRCPSEARGPLAVTRLSAARLRLSTILQNRRASRDNVPRHHNGSEGTQFRGFEDPASEDFSAQVRTEGQWWKDPEDQRGSYPN